jgi:hypothetical protein
MAADADAHDDRDRAREASMSRSAEVEHGIKVFHDDAVWSSNEWAWVSLRCRSFVAFVS